MSKTPGQFLNVDLDVESRGDLGPLVAAIARGAFDLNNVRRRGRHRVTFELAREPSSADAAIRRFASLLDRLPAAGRSIWDGATRRDFDVGVAASSSTDPVMVELSSEAVRYVAALHGRVVV